MGVCAQSFFLVFSSTAKEIELIICKLNFHSSHSYAIPYEISVTFGHILNKPISDLFNLSVSTGIFPDTLKVALAIHIYKSSSKKLLNNYILI